MEGKHNVIAASALQYGQQQAQIDAHSAFGVVFQGRYNSSEVAIKKSKLQGENDYFLLSSWADEVAKLQQLSNANVARFLGVCEEKGSWALVQDWVDGSDLRQVMKSSYRDGADNHFASFVGKQMAEGLAYLHANGVVHMNLSPGNVIINAGRSGLKLRDYGVRTFKFANFADKTTHGNPRYAAVEVMMRQHDSISPASDVWSWSFLMWEVATGEVAFGSYKPPQISRKIWEAGDRPDLEDVKDSNLAKIIARGWSKSPASRPSVNELISAAQELGRNGTLKPSGEKRPALFQPNDGGPAVHVTPASSSSKVDESLDDMLDDLDKLL